LTDEAQARAAALLEEFREAEVPEHGDLAASVVHRARWQRQVRHVLVSIGTAAGGIGGGLAHFVRRRP